MFNYKTNDYFVASKNLSGIDIICKVLSVDDSLIQAQDVSSKRKFTFSSSTHDSISEVGFYNELKPSPEYRILGHVPRHILGDYDSMLEYMNKKINWGRYVNNRTN